MCLFVDVALRAAGSLDFRQSRFPFLLMLPCGRIRSWKNMFFCICYMSSKLQNMIIWLDWSIIEHLVLKNTAECISQRLNRTSGARIMIIFGCLVVRSLGRSVARSIARLIARSVGRSVAHVEWYWQMDLSANASSLVWRVAFATQLLQWPKRFGICSGSLVIP